MNESSEYALNGIEDLTEASRRLLADANIPLVDVYDVWEEFASMQESIKDGWVFSGPTAIRRHAKHFAARTIISLELMHHEKVVFPTPETANIPVLVDGHPEFVALVRRAKCVTRGDASIGGLLREATFSMEQYLHLKGLLEYWDDEANKTA